MKKPISYRIESKAVDGSATRHGHSSHFDKAVDAAHAEVSRLPPGRRTWKQPEVFVYEEFSDGSSELVFYEFAVNG